MSTIHAYSNLMSKGVKAMSVKNVVYESCFNGKQASAYIKFEWYN